MSKDNVVGAWREWLESNDALTAASLPGVDRKVWLAAVERHMKASGEVRALAFEAARLVAEH